MDPVLFYTLLFVISFAISVITTPIVIRIARHNSLYDTPNHRKIHNSLTSRLGGVGIFLGFIISLMIFQDQIEWPFNLNIYMLALIIVFAMGFYDDLKDLRPRYKLLVQLLVGLIVGFSGLKFDETNFFGFFIIEYGAFAYIITSLWIVAFINAINLIDGIDGLASGIAIIASIFFLIIGILQGSPAAAMLSMLLIGPTLGFYIFNFPPAKIFMGDGGAYLLGFICATIPLMGIKKASVVNVLLVPFILLIIPIFDTINVIYSRIKHKKHIFTADKNHIHHRLRSLGFSNIQILILIYTSNILLGLLSILMVQIPPIFGVYILIIVFLLLSVIFYLLYVIEKNFLRLKNEYKKPEIIDTFISRKDKSHKSSSMDNILIIASYSTHLKGARGIQAQRLFKELADHYNIYLLTSNNSKAVHDSELKNIKGIFALPELNYRIKGILRRLWFFWSQKDILFYLKAKKILPDIIQQHDIKDILTFSTAFVNADLGMHIKAKHKDIRLISFLSDPLSFNPLFFNRKWQKKSLEKYEKKLFFSSNKVIFPSKTMQEIYVKKYPEYKDRFHTIPHSFNMVTNRSGIKHEEAEIASPRKICHFGMLYSLRNPISLFKYIKNNEKYFETNNIEFHFYGAIQKKLLTQISRYNSGAIKLHGKIPYNDVEQNIMGSFALLVIDADIKNSPFLPSKLIEYLAYRIPIIALTPKDSETERVILETGHYCFDYHDLDKLKDCIESIENNGSSRIRNIENYDIKNVVNLWKNII